MAIPAAAKIGGGLLAAVAVPVTIHATSDHMFLYAVEREVINNKDSKLTVSSSTGEDNKIVVTVSAETLTSGSSWTCEFKEDPKPTSSSVTSDLATKIQKHLPKDSPTDLQRKNKELLVRACSKYRKEFSNTAVKGVLKIQKQNESTPETLVFTEVPELNFLLKDSSAS